MYPSVLRPGFRRLFASVSHEGPVPFNEPGGRLFQSEVVRSGKNLEIDDFGLYLLGTTC